jgi:hypothetical protein
LVHLMWQVYNILILNFQTNDTQYQTLGGGGSPPPAHYEASQLRLVHTRKNILVCSARWIYDLKTKISSECSLNW